MAIGFDKGFQLHSQGMKYALSVLKLLLVILPMQIPLGYKAKGVDFKQALAKAANNQQIGMSRTHDKHFDVRTELNNSVNFRIPNQPDTGDGNTVDVQVERNLYLKNSLEYQASVQFLNGKIKAMKKVISGGQ